VTKFVNKPEKVCANPLTLAPKSDAHPQHSAKDVWNSGTPGIALPVLDAVRKSHACKA
jgi:hypothetical protein